MKRYNTAHIWKNQQGRWRETENIKPQRFSKKLQNFWELRQTFFFFFKRLSLCTDTSLVLQHWLVGVCGGDCGGRRGELALAPQDKRKDSGEWEITLFPFRTFIPLVKTLLLHSIHECTEVERVYVTVNVVPTWFCTAVVNQWVAATELVCGIDLLTVYCYYSFFSSSSVVWRQGKQC